MHSFIGISTCFEGVEALVELEACVGFDAFVGFEVFADFGAFVGFEVLVDFDALEGFNGFVIEGPEAFFAMWANERC
mgnify:CR=1 FL=1